MKKHIVREYYTEALFELMKRKPLADITVSDLVKKSGASRASFYRNYISKEGILDEYLDEMIGNIMQRHPLTEENMREGVLAIFRDILSHREKLTIMKRAGQLERIDRAVYKSTVNQIKQLNVHNNKYQPYFFAGASAALIKAWIEFNFEESPEKMTEIFFHSLAGYMSV